MRRTSVRLTIAMVLHAVHACTISLSPRARVLDHVSISGAYITVICDCDYVKTYKPGNFLFN